MRLSDIAAMAWHSLWSRKGRTALSLVGVVLSCIVLTMTLAGTRGVSRSFADLIDKSEDVRRFAIYPSYEPTIQPPEEELVVEGVADPRRRERLRRQLKESWLARHGKPTVMGEQELKRFRQAPHLLEVVPMSEMGGVLKLGESEMEARVSGVSPQNSRFKDRVIAGKPLHSDDSREVILSEFMAFRLGFRSDQELAQLIGQELEIVFRIRGQRLAWLLDSVLGGDISQGDQTQTVLAFSELMQRLDEAPLSEEQKALLRRIAGKSTREQESELTLRESFVVKGVVRSNDDNDLFSFLNRVQGVASADVYLPYKTAAHLQLMHEEFENFWTAIGTVDSVQNLRAVIDEIEGQGFHTSSALWIAEEIDREISKARLAISTLAIIILAISAVGISNTMVVAVLERTQEFGILKGLGARDSHIVLLMLGEGALTGLLGAALAMGLSFTIARMVAYFVRNYVSSRIGEEFAGGVFAFTPQDAGIVLLGAISVCTVASLLPAYRAARLDPIVAMRK